jgi:DNA-binding MarR family transcriptional regulator
MADKGLSITPCNNAAIRQAARMLGQLYDDALAPSGLRATQHNLLHTIHRMDRPTLREMATALVMDLSALGHTLKPLVRDGLVTVTTDAQDRRAKRATLTKAGSKKLQETTRLWRAAQSRFEDAFGLRRAVELREGLASVSTDEFRQAFRDGRPVANRRQRD